MSLLSVWMVTAVVFFGTPAAFFSFTRNRDAFHMHPTPQMWTASKLCRQLWKNSRFGAVYTNGSKSDLGYAVDHVCWEDNESSHLETCQVANRKDGSFADEQLDGFSNVVTNSGGAVIGGSCTGGLLVLCILIYLLYRLLKDDAIVHPKTEHDPPATNATNTNQNGSSCPHCGPPPPYNQVVTIEECADPCICMSKPSIN